MGRIPHFAFDLNSLPSDSDSYSMGRNSHSYSMGYHPSVSSSSPFEVSDHHEITHGGRGLRHGRHSHSSSFYRPEDLFAPIVGKLTYMLNMDDNVGNKHKNATSFEGLKDSSKKWVF